MKNNKQSLATALREAGRLFQQTKPVDLGPIQAMIGPWCERLPTDGVRVRELLAAAEADAARGDRESGVRQFRAAIQFVCACDKAAMEARKSEKAKEE